jgi:hypothetical protein
MTIEERREYYKDYIQRPGIKEKKNRKAKERRLANLITAAKRMGLDKRDLSDEYRLIGGINDCRRKKSISSIL